MGVPTAIHYSHARLSIGRWLRQAGAWKRPRWRFATDRTAHRQLSRLVVRCEEPSDSSGVWVGMRSYQGSLWRSLADEARNVAQSIRHPDLKLQLLLVAARYLVLAKRAEQNQPKADEPA